MRGKTVAVVLGRLIPSNDRQAAAFADCISSTEMQAATAAACLSLEGISGRGTAAVIALTLAMRCARRKVSGEMGNNELSVPSRRRMECDMSHIFCATVPW